VNVTEFPAVSGLGEAVNDDTTGPFEEVTVSLVIWGEDDKPAASVTVTETVKVPVAVGEQDSADVLEEEQPGGSPV
jgi:hypothetical protein